jgi:peroxiredoxin Q/BCP
MKRPTLGLTTVASTLVVSAIALAQGPALKVGEPAPDFELKASDGKTYKLTDFRGKQPVVVAWFPKAFTGGCTKECKAFRTSSEELKKTGAAYFTASTDDVETNTRFAQSLDLDYPILSDPGKDVARAYGVVHEGRDVPERWTYYIDKQGIIRGIDTEVQKRTETAGADAVAMLKKLGL